jgi:arylsulfatase A-like enzyme
MPKPNLLFVFADQLRRDSLGYNGEPRARTPNLDRLCEQGVNFSNAISGHPVCAPFRASLFTGKYTSSTGMIINTVRMNPNHECFGHVLTAAGYQISYIGKWHLWGTKRGDYYDPEYAYTPPGPYRLGFDGRWAAYNFQHNYYLAEYYEDTPAPIKVHGYEPDFQTDLAIEHMTEMAASGRPFAQFLSFGTPHDPWARCNVPEEFAKSFDWVDFDDRPPNFMTGIDAYRDDWTFGEGLSDAAEYLQCMRCYHAQTANLDWNMGRLLKALDEMGLAENTIVVFTSDHGYMFGEHGRAGKCTFYEEAIRVPMLIRWGANTPAGHTTDVCLNTPDIMPTILSLMGLPVPAAAEGIDLSAHARGTGGPEPEYDFLQGMGETDAWNDGFEWRAVRDKTFTYAVYREPRLELLFNHVDDRYQLENLIYDPSHADLAARLRKQMTDRMAELGDTFESAGWYHEHWFDDQENVICTATLKE